MTALSKLHYMKNCVKAVLFLCLTNNLPLLSMQQAVTWQQASGISLQLTSLAGSTYELRSLIKENKLLGRKKLTQEEKQRIITWLSLGVVAYNLSTPCHDTESQEAQQLYTCHLMAGFKDLCLVPWFMTTALHCVNGVNDLFNGIQRSKIPKQLTTKIICSKKSTAKKKHPLRTRILYTSQDKSTQFIIYASGFFLCAVLAAIYIDKAEQECQPLQIFNQDTGSIINIVTRMLCQRS